MSRSLKIINILMFFIGFSAICALIAEYGFGLDLAASNKLHKYQFYGVYIFCALQMSKLIFIQNPARYIAKRWVDFTLVFLMFFQLAAGFGLQDTPEYLYLVETGNPVPLASISLAAAQIYFLLVMLLESRFLAHLILGLNLNPMLIFVLSFFGLAFLGTFSLMLPKAAALGAHVSFADAFFTAASAASGTGLSTVNIADTFSVLGQTVIMLLMQTGPFGMVVMLTLMIFFSGDKIDKNEVGAFTAVVNIQTLADAKKYLIRILGLMFVLEAATAVYLYYFSGYNDTAFMKVFYALFHSVSALTNTGLALYPNADFSFFIKVPNVLMWMGFLMFLGSLGNTNLLELPGAVKHFFKKRYDKISVNIKAVTAVNAILLAVSLPLGWYFLKDNALKNLSFYDGIVNAVFTVVSARSSGLCAIDLSFLGAAGVTLFVILMVIGGGPVSFAGGIRTISLSVLFVYFKNKIFGVKGSSPVLFGVAVGQKTVRKVMCIVISYFIVLAAGALSVFLIENFEFKQVVFEVASGIGTTGLSMGITGMLGMFSKIIISFCMLFGAFVHPLSVIIVNYFDKSKENIIVG